MRLADRHLVDKCLNGDSAAFGMLVDRYKESVYALAYSRLRNFHDAEDVTQEAFTKAYQKLRTLRRWDEFHAWIYAITANLCKNWIKASARRPDREFIEDISASSLSRYSRSSGTMLEVLHEALDSLPESYQQVLTLHYLGGMDGREIAEFLGKSPSAIWQRLSRARASLKKEILDMMSDTYEQNRLRSGFTFRIVEIVKRIRIDPVPPKTLPWGFSIATGIIIGILCVGMNVNLTNTEFHTSASSLSGEPVVQEVGEFPVDVMRVSDISVTSGQQLPGNGLGNVVAGLQNALLMAPQAEGGTWAKKADMPTARYELSPAAGVVNGKIYIIGGSNVNYLSTVEEYNPATDKWIEMKNMPTERGNLSTCVLNGKIYALGGFKAGVGIELSTIEEYDPIADKWIRKADMPTGRQYFSANAIGDKIYVMGGWRRGGVLSTTEEYDPVKDEWTKKADMLNRRYGFSASAVNGKIYVIGGCSFGGTVANGKTLSTVEEYDPALDKWMQKADMPTSRMFLTTSVANGKIYAIGGGTIEDNLWSDITASVVEEYDPATDTWTKKTDMPIGRYGMSNATVNEKIYVFGGFNKLLLLVSTVEEYDPEAESKSIDFKGKLPTTWGEVRTASSK